MGTLTANNSRDWAFITSGTFYMGQRGNNSDYGFGLLDEIRVSSVIRSDDWICAVFDTIFSNSVFTCYQLVENDPDIDVTGTNDASIVDGDTTPLVADGTDYGTVNVSGETLSHTFAITNIGTTNLILSGSPVVSIIGHSDFTVTAQPVSTNIGPSISTTFTIQFDPSVLGLRTATVSIVNNTPGESPYDFLIQGTGGTPEMDVTGNAVSIADNDLTPNGVDGTDYGAVDVASQVGTQTFTIANSGTVDLFLTGTPTVALSGDVGDFTVTAQPASTNVGTSGSVTFTIEFDPTTTGLRSALVTIRNNDLDEDPYTFAISGVGVTPEIDVLGINGASIANQDFTTELPDGTDFGSVSVGAGAPTHTFTVTNAGTFQLELNGAPAVQLFGDTGDFSVTVQPSTPVAVANGSIFVVQFNPTVLGVRTARV
ncbi:MAG: choice-of-anchor D domain-containing protein, partial [Verrucomicrobiota bacterium]